MLLNQEIVSLTKEKMGTKQYPKPSKDVIQNFKIQVKESYGMPSPSEG